MSALLVPPDQRVAIVPTECGQEILEHIQGQNQGLFLFQLDDLGSAATIFWSLAHVIARDPEANLLICSSDCSVHFKKSFLDATLEAFAAIERIPKKIILFGTGRSRQTHSSIWLQQGQKFRRGTSAGLWTVKGMGAEQDPSRNGNGGLQYASMLVAKAKLLWSLGLTCLPEILAPFARLSRSPDDSNESTLLKSLNKNNLKACFAMDFLARVRRHLAVMKLGD